MCVDEHGRPSAFEQSGNVRYFLEVMRAFDISAESGLSAAANRGPTYSGGTASFSLIYERGVSVIGVPREEVLERAPEATLLLNVMGYLDDSEILGRIERRVFVDIDPGFGQMWRELGLHDAFRGHDDFVTMGRHIGRPGCTIPTCGLDWITMPQPVVLEEWPAISEQESGRSAPTFTSIGAWRGPNDAIEYNGQRYGLRAHEFRKYVSLPSLCPEVRFEMALDIHAGDEQDLRLLREQEWKLVDPMIVANGPWRYRDYIAASTAEFMVPKQMYVATKSGLLSDRSAYYLACGRPVVARDTGLGDLYPTGEGLLTFSTLDEARQCVEDIVRDTAGHSRAARRIAVDHFDSDKVLTDLLSELGVNHAADTR
jgi:hypothetical protein